MRLRSTDVTQPFIAVVAIAIVTTLTCGCGQASTGSRGVPTSAATPSSTAAATVVRASPTATTPAPTVTAAASPTAATPETSEGYGMFVNVDYGPPVSPATLAGEYELFVTGNVVEVLPAQWTTPDGQPPPNSQAVDSDETFIITPVVIELDGPPIVNRTGTYLAADRLVLAAFGGQVGNDQMATNDASQQFEVGQHVLVGLSAHPFMHGDVTRRY
jgi:hypothetical protein